MFSKVLSLTGCVQTKKTSGFLTRKFVFRCSESHEPIDCLRAADSTVLQAANLQANSEAFSGTFAFVPVVDGSFIEDIPSRLLSKGKVNAVGSVISNQVLQKVLIVLIEACSGSCKHR